MTIQINVPLEFAFLQPVVVPLVRFGNHRDGGYVGSIKCISDGMHVISLGISDDWSFEKELFKRKRNVKVHSYDPTIGPKVFLSSIKKSVIELFDFRVPTLFRRFKVLVRKFLVFIDYFVFFRGDSRRHFRLWAKSSKNSPDSRSLNEILKLIEPIGGVVLKIDVEGSEYELLEELIVCGETERIEAIFVEFHGISENWSRFKKIVESIKNDFSIIHLHANNCNKLIGASGIPDVLEISFLHKRLVEENGMRTALPLLDLDFPNDSGREDFEIFFDLKQNKQISRESY